MRRAVQLSRRGFPAPNPHVGCVLVRDGEIVGEGYHHHAGGPHAEVVALRQAGGRAKRATAYVTLEPCNHYGRTPPCSLALREAGVARVVVACPDPNPRAAGGASALREAGIPVETGFLEAEAAAANVQFLTAMRLRRPYVVVKAAASLDGRIALPSGESQWITGPAARRAAHRLRAECGAVLVGRRTVEADDPRLTARIPGVVNQPLRVVLDPDGRLSPEAKAFDGEAPTLRVTRADGLAAWTPEGFDLPSLLASLFERGVLGLLVEGGAATISGFVRAGLVDRLELFLGPKVLGAGPSWLEDAGIGVLADAPTFGLGKSRRLNDDLWLSFVPMAPTEA